MVFNKIFFSTCAWKWPFSCIERSMENRVFRACTERREKYFCCFTPAGSWFFLNVLGKFKNPAISLDNSSININPKLESSYLWDCRNLKWTGHVRKKATSLGCTPIVTPRYARFPIGLSCKKVLFLHSLKYIV